LFRLQSTTVDEVFVDRGEYEALGLVGYELLPHMNRFDGEFLERVRQYSERVGHDIVAIEDGSAVIHSALDDYRCVGSAKRFRNGLMTLIGTAA
jgi:peptidase E